MRERWCETVMVVNDDPSFVDVVGDSLRAEGLAVLLVPGVPQGVAAMLTGFRPDAILVDVLRRSDLGDLLDAVGRDPELRQVPVLARAPEGEHILHIASGRADPVPLPADARQLAELLEHACARSAAAAGSRDGRRTAR